MTLPDASAIATEPIALAEACDRAWPGMFSADSDSGSNRPKAASLFTGKLLDAIGQHAPGESLCKQRMDIRSDSDADADSGPNLDSQTWPIVALTLPLITAALPERGFELEREDLSSGLVPPAQAELLPLRTDGPDLLPVATRDSGRTEVARITSSALPAARPWAPDVLPGGVDLPAPHNDNSSQLPQLHKDQSKAVPTADPAYPPGWEAAWNHVSVRTFDTAHHPQSWFTRTDAFVRGQDPSLPAGFDRDFLRVDSTQSLAKMLVVVEALPGIRTFPLLGLADTIEESELCAGSTASGQGATTARTLLHDPESAFQLRIEQTGIDPQGQQDQDTVSRKATAVRFAPHPVALKQLQRGATGIRNRAGNPEVAGPLPTVINSVSPAISGLPGADRTLLSSPKGEVPPLSTLELTRASARHSSTTESQPDAVGARSGPRQLSAAPRQVKPTVTAEMAGRGATIESGVLLEPGDRNSATQPVERYAAEADAISGRVAGPIDRSPLPISNPAVSPSIHSPQPEDTRTPDGTRGLAHSRTSELFSEPPTVTPHLGKDRVTEIKVDIPASDLSHVQVKLRESRGEILLDVKASDGPTRVALRESLHELVRSLDHQGFSSTHSSGNQQQPHTSDGLWEGARDASGDMSDRGQQQRSAQEELTHDRQDRRGTHQQAWERWMEQITWQAQFNR